MTLNLGHAYATSPRSARAVPGSVARRRPRFGILAAELAVLALMFLVAAGSVALRAWLTMPN